MNSYAPYTFLPFEDDLKIKDPYASREELPGFDTVDPNRISGYISYEAENLTPISIGVSDKDTLGDKAFFKDGRGRYAIPGSTMRGFVRSHSEILSFSDPSDGIEDSHLMYRSFANKSTDSRKKDYLNEIGTGVEAGIISLKRDSSGEHYEIQPLDVIPGTKVTFFSVHEADIPRTVLSKLSHFMYSTAIRKKRANESKDDYFAYLEGLENSYYEVYRESSPVKFDIDPVTNEPCNFGSGKLEGIFLNSAYMAGKQHHYLVSNTPEDVPSIHIPVEYSNAYKADYDANCIQNKKLKMNAFFYDLPIGNQKKIFFYKMAGGRLVGFGPTRYFRIFYQNTVHDGIPNGYRRDSIDYVHAMYGITGEKGSYRSRLSFQNAVCEAPVGKESEEARVLLSPRATAIQMYLDQSAFTNKKSMQLANYNTAGMHLHGYKFYWKRTEVQPDVEVKNNAVRKTFSVLPSHCVFKGRIWFENLSKEELGLLLLSLRYSDTDAKETFMLGKGKPYGFGVVTLKNIRLFQLDPKDRYGCLDLKAEKDCTAQITDYKTAFRQSITPEKPYEGYKAPSLYGKYAQYDELEDFREGGHKTYMDMKGYKALEPLETLKSVIDKKEKAEASIAARRKAEENEERKKQKKAAEAAQKQAEIASLDRSMLVVYYSTDALPQNLKDSLKSKVGARCHIEEGEKSRRIDPAVMQKDGQSHGIAAFGQKMNNADMVKAKEYFDKVYYVDRKAGKLVWNQK